MNRTSLSFTSLSVLLSLGILMPASNPSAHAQSAPGTMGATQSLDFSQLATQNVAPARLQLKNLNKGWQRLTVEGGNEDPYAAIYGGWRGTMYQEAMTDAGIGVYFTRGQSVTLGGETFLVAYRIENNMSAQDIQNLFRNIGGHGNTTPNLGPRKFSPDTTLLLSLLNLRTVGTLKDVRPFNPKSEIMGPGDVIADSNENLEALGRLLVKMQGNNYRQRGWPLRDAATMRRTFDAYFHPNQRIYVHPRTKEAYRTNAAIAKMPNRTVSNKARVVAIYEPRPGTDGKYGTVFLDGHVERIPSHRWQAVRAVLPAKPSPQEIRRLSDNNLQQLYSSLMRYSSMRQGKLPQMQNASVVRQEFANYIGGSYPNHPGSGEPYRPNATLSFRNVRNIANRSRLIAFYEASPGSDGKRSAIFLDGRIERIPSSRWNKVRTVSVQIKPVPASPRQA